MENAGKCEVLSILRRWRRNIILGSLRLLLVLLMLLRLLLLLLLLVLLLVLVLLVIRRLKSLERA
jgi:hypothetical protein